MKTTRSVTKKQGFIAGLITGTTASHARNNIACNKSCLVGSKTKKAVEPTGELKNQGKGSRSKERYQEKGILKVKTIISAAKKSKAEAA